MNDLTALREAYACGIFPMADSRNAPDCYFLEKILEI